MPELCRICHTKRAKRPCPGVSGDICSLCCGEQREVNISCPLDCQFLQEARRHEKGMEDLSDKLPHPEITVTESFIDDYEELIVFCLFTLADAALRTPGVVDADLLEALEALISNQRALNAGVIYQTKPTNQLSASIQSQFERSLADFQKQRSGTEGLQPYQGWEILNSLAMAERTAVLEQNGRPRCRAFIDLLRHSLNISLPLNAQATAAS